MADGDLNCYPGFSQSFFDFPKKEKLKFLYNFFQNPRLSKFSKNREYVVEPYLGIQHAKFQVDIPIFG